MEYKPLEDYGVIGNLETVALVGCDGAVDWCCFPDVDSPSIFADILDSKRGGHCTVQPTDSYQALQRYVDRTNVLQTRFQTASGQATVTDFMPVPEVADESQSPVSAIYRHVTCESGAVELGVEFEPRFDYARTKPTVESAEHGVVAADADEAVFFSSSAEFRISDHSAATEVQLSEGETCWFVLGYGTEIPNDSERHRQIRDDVVRYWRDWANAPESGERLSDSQWRQFAVRSALTLKLLTNHESGAICAAPTTSLPEDIGGIRNWDYRYNWIRDATFTVRALAELGHEEEAHSYFDLCLDHCSRHEPADIHPMYGLDGGEVPDERTLDNLSGYRDSAPVRVGNAAADQYQLDVYGELVQGVYAARQYGKDVEKWEWSVVRDIVDYVCEAWQEPDAGMWETRSDHQHFVYSKVMCWVAIDRGLKIVDETPFEGSVDEWEESRNAIKEAVLQEGYSETADSFVRSFGDEDTLDATSLLIPTVGFLPADDSRVQATIDATLERLVADDRLVKRYEGDDGLPGEEGAFALCSFWLVSALALSGRVEEATTIFEDVLEYVSPLGLLAEEVDPETERQVGNYPQAFSHIGLINSVLYLQEAREKTRSDADAIGSDTAFTDSVGSERSTGQETGDKNHG